MRRGLLIVGALLLTSLACQALSFGGGEQNKSDESSVPSSSNENGGSEDIPESDFPITNDAYNILDTGDGSVLYYTKLPQEDVMQFYRSEYTSRGYIENELLTVVSDGVFSMVFDGDPSGKAVVIQSVDLGDGSRTVNIRLE